MAESNGILDGATATVNNDYYGIYPGENVIDGDISTFWHTDGVGVPHWIKFDFGAGNAIAGGDYQLTTRNTGDQHAPVDWLFQGSNDDSNWDTLDTQTDITDWTNGVTKEFSCSNTTAYKYYRFWITETLSNTYCCLGEVGITAAGGGAEYDYPPVVNLEFSINIVTYQTEDGTTAHPPTGELQISPKNPKFFMPIVLVAAAQIFITTPVPTFYMPVMLPPVVNLKLEAPQNTEAGTVVSLLKFNTTPDSEDIADETGRAWTVPHPAVPTETKYPNLAKVSADGPFDGLGSFYSSTTTSYIRTPYTDDLDIGRQDFTFECWYRVSSLENWNMPALWTYDEGWVDPVQGGLRITGDWEGLTVRMNFTDAYEDWPFRNVLMLNFAPLREEWSHIAVVRRGRTIYAFDNGILKDSELINPESNGILNSPIHGMLIGAGLSYEGGNNGLGVSTAVGFAGNIAGVKMTTGFGKWIAGFTPPTTPPVFDEPFRTYARSSVNTLGAINLTKLDPTWKFIHSVQVPETEIEIGLNNPAIIWSLNAAMRPASQVIYICTLTGTPDGVDDAVLPISSFIARMRNGEPSYLSCVIPNSSEYEAEISARPNGKIIIQKGYRLIDGSINLAEIARVDFEAMQIDRGARNDSATIIGHKTTTADAPKERTVQGVSFYGLQADGKRRFRAAMDLFLSPGDTAIYGTGGGDYFVVGSISYSVNIDQATMEVTEE